VSIAPVSLEAGEEVLRLALGGLSAQGAAEQMQLFLANAPCERRSTACLWEARRAAELVGAVVAQVQPGRTATVWPPQTVPPEPLATAQRLLTTACEGLALQGVRLAHAVLEKVPRVDNAVLRHAGFQPLATLLYLVCPESEFPDSPPSGSLQLEPFATSTWDRLARLVEATYEETLDCPFLNGLRSMEDVLAGYQATGVFAPERWLFVRHQDQDIGCLLLADHPQEENWELVYMGLVPSVRGNGWGREVIRHAQWLTRQAGRPRLVLAVDAGNHPAVTVYTCAGFRAWGRRRVYLKVLA
jgi:GNAT superfamily N-acetyltransferase